MATIKDVASLAGFSKTLVSRTLNDQPGVSEDARRLIREAAASLQYRPNVLARSLVLKKTQTVGVVLDSLCIPYYFDLIRGIERAAAAAGYRVLYCSAGSAETGKAAYIDFFAQGYVDGIVIYGSDCNSLQLIARLQAMRFPTAVIEQAIGGAAVNNVLLDNAAGARMATERLLAAGCKDVRHFMGDIGKTVSADRLKGYVEAMTAHGRRVEAKHVLQADFKKESGKALMEALIAAGDVPDGIFVAADEPAYGAMEALYAHGYEVPRDVRIVGFDDDQNIHATQGLPGLTTIRQPLREMGGKAVEMLIRTIQSDDAAAATALFVPELVERETC